MLPVLVGLYWNVCVFVCRCRNVCIVPPQPPPPTSTYEPVGQLPRNLAYQWILLQYRNSYESTLTNNNIAYERTWLFVQLPLRTVYSENPPNECLCLDSEIIHGDNSYLTPLKPSADWNLIARIYVNSASFSEQDNTWYWVMEKIQASN